MDDIVDLDGTMHPEPRGECVDSDGDGYGWDGVATCFPSGFSPQELANLEQEIVDNWPESDGRSTYQVIQELPSLKDATFAFPTSEEIYGPGFNFVTNTDIQLDIDLSGIDLSEPEPPCIDNDRDGYGFNGIETCYVGGVRPAWLDEEPDPAVEAELDAFTNFWAEIDLTTLPSFQHLDNVGTLDMFPDLTTSWTSEP